MLVVAVNSSSGANNTTNLIIQSFEICHYFRSYLPYWLCGGINWSWQIINFLRGLQQQNNNNLRDLNNIRSKNNWNTFTLTDRVISEYNPGNVITYSANVKYKLNEENPVW